MNKKRVLNALLSAALISTPVVSGFMQTGVANVLAAEISINTKYNEAKDAFEAYQIFVGTIPTSDNESGNKLGVSGWGNGINQARLADLITKLKADPFNFTLADYDGSNADYIAVQVATQLNSTNVEKFAKLLVGDTSSPTFLSSENYKSEASSNKVAKISVPDNGYYLIKQVNTVTGGAISSFILDVFDGAAVDVKASAPTVEKKIKKSPQNTAWVDETAGYSKGDKVTYKLTANLPTDHFDDYTEYYLEFRDKLSKGLTSPDNIRVYIGDESGTLITTGYTSNIGSFEDSDNGFNLNIVFTDILKLTPKPTAGGKITVLYDAIVDTDAVVGQAGNPNDVDLVYSNDPNVSSSRGTSQKDQVLNYVIDLEINKVDGQSSDTKLDGAVFNLYFGDTLLNFDSNGNVSKTGTSNLTTTNGKISVSGLAAGTYTLKEVTAPTGYNKLNQDITFTIEAEFTEEGFEGDAKYKVTNVTPSDYQAAFTPGANAATVTSISTTIANNKGPELPSTGGMGTTFLYIGGAVVLAAGAIVLTLTSKKKRN